MSDTTAADERAILDQLRKAQDAHHSGDHDTANAVLNDVFDRYGRETVKAVRSRPAGDQLGADVALYSMFGVAGLIGDD